jgi:hypothetical protein
MRNNRRTAIFFLGLVSIVSASADADRRISSGPFDCTIVMAARPGQADVQRNQG